MREIKMKILSGLAFGAVIALGACTSSGPSVQDDMTIVEAGGPGQCKQADWQSYVGKPRQSLPSAPQGLTFRVLCDTCAATMDYRADRVSFTYDDKNMITRVSCG